MCFLLFFFKQKTAYEMRISDWSSDVCSSDLEILASDVGKGLGSMPSGDDPIDDAAPKDRQSSLRTALQSKEQGESFDGKDGKGDEQQMQAIAAALSKEKGFRSARYMGNRRFEIDYAIGGDRKSTRLNSSH